LIHFSEGGDRLSILTNSKGHTFLEFIKLPESQIESSELDAPLTHSLLVIKYEHKFLLIFNKWRKHWELPGGIIDQGETPRESAIRELFEETNQSLSDLDYKGLMKFQLKPDDRIEYGALYSGELPVINTFIENDEAAKIIFWDQKSDIGYIDEIDEKLIEYF
jgi:8-oxo-dGTP diphosphatase